MLRRYGQTILIGVIAIVVLIGLDMLVDADKSFWCPPEDVGLARPCGRVRLLFFGVGMIVLFGGLIWWSVREMRRQSRLRSGTGKPPPERNDG